LRTIVGKIKRDDECIIIAKLINQLRAEEFVEYKDDESRLLQETRKFLASDSGTKWGECGISQSNTSQVYY